MLDEVVTSLNNVEDLIFRMEFIDHDRLNFDVKYWFYDFLLKEEKEKKKKEEVV